MKKRLFAATALPLISMTVMPVFQEAAAAQALTRPIILAQATTEETTEADTSECAEDDAECLAKEEEKAASESGTTETESSEPTAEESTTEESGEAAVDAETSVETEETAPAASAAEEETATEPASEEAPADETATEEEPAAETDDEDAAASTQVEQESEASTEAETTTEETTAEDTEKSATTAETDSEDATATEATATEEEATTKTETESTSETTAEETLAVDEEKLKIAEDPENAEGTVELPVENGAAILDSAKEEESSSTTTSSKTAQPRLLAVPESDAEAQASSESSASTSATAKSALTQDGRRMDRAPRYEEPEGRIVGEDDGRLIIDFGNGISIRFNDGERVRQGARETYYEQLPGGYTRQVVERPNGDTVITIRDRWGDIVQRSRIHDGREYILYYDPEGFDGDGRRRRDDGFRDPGRDLPPMRLPVPLSDYIIDTSTDNDRDYEAFLAKPPVEPVERIYSLDEVRHSARIRDKVRRIDLDTVNFETGSAEVAMNEAKSLRNVADAMNEILENDPGETFLIEGHTDAVGSDRSNLILSDKRAESVADVLTELFDVPPENLATQGYGERYLKVKTEGPSALNRRVTIRRVTPLVRPANAKVVEQ